jgi:hypothetical protein
LRPKSSTPLPPVAPDPVMTMATDALPASLSGTGSEAPLLEPSSHDPVPPSPPPWAVVA